MNKSTNVRRRVNKGLSSTIRPIIFRGVLPSITKPTTDVTTRRKETILSSHRFTFIYRLNGTIRCGGLLAVTSLKRAKNGAPRLTPHNLNFRYLLLPLPISTRKQIKSSMLRNRSKGLVLQRDVARPRVIKITTPSRRIHLNSNGNKKIRLLPRTNRLGITIRLISTFLRTTRRLTNTRNRVMGNRTTNIRINFKRRRINRRVSSVPTNGINSHLLTGTLERPPRRVLRSVTTIRNTSLIQTGVTLFKTRLLSGRMRNITLRRPLSSIIGIRLYRRVLYINEGTKRVVPRIKFGII